MGNYKNEKYAFQKWNDLQQWIMMSACDHWQRYSQTAYHSHGFDGVGEDGGFRSG